jgi:dimethylhistidine N-methyltransferase
MTPSQNTETRPVKDSFTIEVLEGLTATPRTISPAFFYDAKGSELFDEITRQPEYYQARTERSILDSVRSDLAAHLKGPIELVEFGAGSAEKTETLLEALDVATYRPVDVSASALEGAAKRLGGLFPSIAIDAVVQDYHNPVELGPLPKDGSRVAFFPGSTVGNFHPSEAAKFLARVARMVGKGGALVLGVDLVKDPDVLHAAYNDAAGVTAAFNLNALRHVNERTGAGFDLETWKHYAFYNPMESRIEMHLVCTEAQEVHLAGQALSFDRFDSIWTESSYKYTAKTMGELARAAGFSVETVWKDEKKWFGVMLLRAMG